MISATLSLSIARNSHVFIRSLRSSQRPAFGANSVSMQWNTRSIRANLLLHIKNESFFFIEFQLTTSLSGSNFLSFITYHDSHWFILLLAPHQSDWLMIENLSPVSMSIGNGKVITRLIIRWTVETALLSAMLHQIESSTRLFQ